MTDLLLLVEGQDDVHVVSRLLERHSLTRLKNPNDRNVNPLRLLFGDIPLDIKPVKNIDKAVKQFETTLKFVGVRPKAVGLILDFDPPSETQANNRHETLRNMIAGIQNKECRWDLPENFTVLVDGGFIEEPVDADTPRVGIWFMPDNRNRGMLETFLQELIPKSQSGLLDHARHSTDTAKEKHQAPFKPVHRDKAVVHTFLAWMDEPGHPFGQSFQNGSFDAQSAPAGLFVEWVKKLFC